MLRDRSIASRTFRPLVVSVTDPFVVWGRAKPTASSATAASRNENASQRGRGLPRRSSFGRSRGAAKTAHCLRRKRAVSTAPTTNSGISSSSSNQAGSARVMARAEG
jgi:hypothetical protein